MGWWRKRTFAAAGAGIVLTAATACGGGDEVADVSGIDLPGAPAGFALTPPGKSLKFGEPAYIVTRAKEGPGQYWAVTAKAPKDVQANPADFKDGTNVDHLVCFVYAVKFLGAGNDGSPTGYITEPTGFTVLGDENRLANTLFYGLNSSSAESVCGAGPTRSGSGIFELSKLTAGREFQGAERSFVSKDKDKGVDPTRLGYDYSEEVYGIPSGKNIVWS